MKVVLTGLKTEKYNGATGVFQGINEKGRHVIKLDGSGAFITVTQEHITAVPSSKKRDNSTNMLRNPATLSPSAWAVGLSKEAASEWFIDCYRMRIDDEYVYSGELRGLYDPDSTNIEKALDFLVFCRLALVRKVVPENWDWQFCLKTHAVDIKFAFEKSDAQEKYGGENVFAVLQGGRSLRATGELVYKTSVMSAGDCSEEDRKLQNQVKKIRWGTDTALFEDVGGFPAWKDLLKAISNQ